MEDLEQNFDDLCTLALTDKKKLEGVGSSPPQARKTLSRSHKSFSGTNLAAAGAAPPEVGSVCMHVIVLSEDKQPAIKSPSMSRVIRQSVADNRADEAQTVKVYGRVLAAKAATLRSNGVRRVSVLLPKSSATEATGADNMNYLSIFNFNGASGYDEEKMLRHILPPTANWLELHRLSNFHVERCWFPDTSLTHVYHATAVSQKLDTRLFVRTVVLRAPASLSELAGLEAFEAIAKTELAASFDILEQAIGDSRYSKSESNHVFFRVLPKVCVSIAKLESAVAAMVPPLLPLIKKFNVTELELAIPLLVDPSDKEKVKAVRVIASLAPSLKIKVYGEVANDVEPGTAPTHTRSDSGIAEDALRRSITGPQAVMLTPIGTTNGEGPKPLKSYAQLSSLDQKRLKCAKLLTTYAYDYIHMYELALKAAWEKAPAGCGEPPAELIEATELELSADGERVEAVKTAKAPGSNKVGMLAWWVQLYTPEYPAGREIVLIANDITYQNGTFGPLEDRVFERASQLARERGVPRVYMAANSGARLGLSDSVKKCVRIQWNDPYDPSRGIAYLWLSEKDKEALGDSVITELVAVPEPEASDDEDEAEVVEEKLAEHNRIVAIIGQEDGLGVESLQGAGRIAAETSIANREIFTLGYSTARNIGIGSYVLRLGQRVIQHRDAPIILTGFQALNKLLGSAVYESNLQLGGPEVMGNNGVSHLLVDSDLDAVARIVDWLGFVPRVTGAPPPCLPIVDPVDRDVGWCSTAGIPYDPRLLLTGGADPDTDGAWKAGLLDEGSFTETLADWAKTVVVGRGRLGGVPVGVIVTENRVVDKNVLADPANLESKPETQMQAGQVWFPDSAYKTAQAIQDFNTGEGLPLLLLANWRGFSGGRKDMYDEVLKFGSFIVDQLTQYRQPILVYIPPHCEIRGGAWVVIDSTINPDFMEMYASPEARGGVLEPAGIAEIKFRKPELVKAMHRIDTQLHWMSMNEASGVVRPEDIAARETELLPSYQPLGELVADLHDRPERMLAKGVIRKIVPWAESRRYFYWRLRRRLREEELVQGMQERDAGLSHAAALMQLHASLPPDSLGDDAKVFALLAQQP